MWHIDAQGGTPIWVGIDSEQVFFPHIAGFGAIASLDGKHLFFGRNKEDGLWRQSVNGGQSGIYYVSRGRPTVIAFMDFNTSKIDTLFTPPHGIPGMDPALSITQDGAMMLFGQNERSESDLMYVDGFE